MEVPPAAAVEVPPVEVPPVEVPPVQVPPVPSVPPVPVASVEVPGQEALEFGALTVPGSNGHRPARGPGAPNGSGAAGPDTGR